VIHGSEDRGLPVPHGVATAEAIPGAKLLVIEGMGREMPPRAQKQILEVFLEHARGR